MPTSSDSSVDQRPPSHLTITDLEAGYGADPVISGVDLNVGLGEVVAVVGPNGAGKSTMLKAIMGQIRVSQGSVRLAGREITNSRTENLARMGVGYIPQNNEVFDTLTVAENLEMGGYLLPRSSVAERIDEVISVFPALALMRSRITHKLSGGERKMVAIGRVLMSRPSLLILDEPTSSLSPELSRMVLREHVARLARVGAAVLLVEQKAMEALEVADHAYIMVSGTTHLSDRASALLARSDIGEIFLGRAVGVQAEGNAGQQV